jgi:hypothetical protein
MQAKISEYRQIVVQKVRDLTEEPGRWFRLLGRRQRQSPGIEELS